MPHSADVLEHAADLAEVSAAFEQAPASRIVAWAWERFGDGLVLAASFQDCVLIDVAARVAPAVEVVFLDTGYHFPETLAYVETVRRRYDLNLRVMRPLVGPDGRWLDDPDGCCAARKVEPLRRALAGKAAWMSGLRRAQAPGRAAAPIVAWDGRAAGGSGTGSNSRSSGSGADGNGRAAAGSAAGGNGHAGESGGRRDGRPAGSGGRRAGDAAGRSGALLQTGRGLVKINPLATWSDARVAAYVRDHDLPVHPLTTRGFPSIGCWPCTRPVRPGEHSRAGRWAGTDKSECGLHG